MGIEREQRLYDALKRIASYDSPERLRRRSAKDYGLDNPDEAIEYAYENVIWEAQAAIKGMRRPAEKAKSMSQTRGMTQPPTPTPRENN